MSVLVPADWHKDIAPYMNVARSLSGGKLAMRLHEATKWWKHIDGYGFGALWYGPNGRTRIKSTYVFPEWRALGHGHAMTQERFDWLLADPQVRIIEGQSVKPDWYLAHGFVAMGYNATTRTTRMVYTK